MANEKNGHLAWQKQARAADFMHLAIGLHGGTFEHVTIWSHTSAAHHVCCRSTAGLAWHAA